METDGVPVTVQYPPSAPGEPCVHHVYKDDGDIPASVYRRVGREKPAR
jgi:hypothetical protein